MPKRLHFNEEQAKRLRDALGVNANSKPDDVIGRVITLATSVQRAADTEVASTYRPDFVRPKQPRKRKRKRT